MKVYDLNTSETSDIYSCKINKYRMETKHANNGF